MSAPKSIEVESLIEQARAGLDHPIPPDWDTTKRLVAFLCDAMEVLVGEVRRSRRAEASLQSRLAAAEAERNEWKDIASVFLAATEPNQPIPVQGQIMLAQVRERARATFDARLASRPEGEVRHG